MSAIKFNLKKLSTNFAKIYEKILSEKGFSTVNSVI